MPACDLYVPDPTPGSVYVITAYALGPKALKAPPGDAKAKEEPMRHAVFPPGWDEDRVRRVLDHHEQQSDMEAVAEDEGAFQRVAARRGQTVGWAFAVAAIALGSFGIYLGRFPRWNSWDLLARPGALLLDVTHRVFVPWDHPRTVAFSFLFGCFFLSAYAVFVASSRLDPEPAVN